MHDTLTIGIPVFAILAGILFNRSDLKDLRSELRGEIKESRGEIKTLRDEVNRRFDDVIGRFDAVDAELRYFHGTTGRLEGRIQSLEGK